MLSLFSTIQCRETIWAFIILTEFEHKKIKVKDIPHLETYIKNQERVKHIREWIDLLAEEPEGELIKVSTVVDNIRRMIE